MPEDGPIATRPRRASDAATRPIATKERMMWIMRRARRKSEVLLVDDLDGTLAHETVQFELDGKHYEIDLSAENARELRRALDPYVDLAKIAYLEEMFT
jgi:hypothetical protein